MEIINRILSYWWEQESDLKKEQSINRQKIVLLTKKFKEAQEESQKRTIDQKNAVGALKDILEFADMLNISHADIPFSVESDSYETESILKEMFEMRKEYDLLDAREKMYTNYLAIISAAKSSGDMFALREKQGRYRSDLEFYEDIYIMQILASKAFKESFGMEYEYRKYVDAIDVFSPTMMVKVGHVSGDDELEDGTAENICKICRISWARDYLTHLADHVNLLERIKDRRGVRKLKKDEAYNSVIRVWTNDTNKLDSDESFKDTVYYKLYRSVLSSEEERDIDYFHQKFVRRL